MGPLAMSPPNARVLPPAPVTAGLPDAADASSDSPPCSCPRTVSRPVSRRLPLRHPELPARPIDSSASARSAVSSLADSVTTARSRHPAPLSRPASYELSDLPAPAASDPDSACEHCGGASNTASPSPPSAGRLRASANFSPARLSGVDETDDPAAAYQEFGAPETPLPATDGLFHRIYSFMKGAHFPLLRSSPALGTGSYGAVPVSYAGSGASSEEDNRGDSTPEETDGEGAERAPLVDDPTLSETSSKARRRRFSQRPLQKVPIVDPAPLPSSKAAERNASVESEDEDSGSAVVDMDSDEEFEDEEDDDDPIDNSPYPEVRASVLATDDESLSINTPRMWTLSLLFTLVGSSTNLFFSLRYPSISITPVIALLLAHPLGRIWDQVFKDDDDDDEEDVDDLTMKQRGRLGRLRRWLGQGRWNRKEHACVYISSNVSFGFAFATDVIVEQTHFYHQNPGITYQILLTLSTQILGYTFAGLTRQWLVRPSSMIWPGTLMSTAMFTTLHGEENKPADGWKISRWKFFVYVFAAGFFWYFIPGLLMPALSYFNVVTWFAPENTVVANLFGVRSGLGLLPLTFDWAQISYIGSPLMTPFWAAANVVGGLVLVMWIIAPVMYYMNSFYSAYMPILSSNVFDNKAHTYDVSRILTKGFRFDEEAYKNYSKVFMPITYVLSYGLQFAALTALVTHTACWHGKDIWTQWKKVMMKPSGTKSEAGTHDYVPIDPQPSTSSTIRRKRRHRRLSVLSDRELDDLIQRDDVHARLMRKYPECPTSWYLATFVVMIAVGIFVVEYYPVYLPWPGLFLALAVCGVFFVPIGIVMAITNTQSSLFLVCQLICGYVFPGRPVANMVFVMYGYITSTQGLKFASDLKLGHYMKIPPRLLFTIQMVATIVGCLTQIGVLNWAFANIPGICTEQALNGFSCPIARVHFNGSILWGVVGPSRFFGRKELYHPLIYAFVIGAIAPVIIWGIWKYRGSHRSSILKSVSLPVLFGSLSWIPPATGLNFSAWALVCYFFNWSLRNRKPGWWAKYTMTLSAGLDASLAVGMLVVFFGVVYPGFADGLKWWGTEVFKKGCDWNGCTYRRLGEGERFGPERGSW